ncbi:MAG: hypothetical protein QOE33_1904 [Acidobacteriota bacterium]|nr:hypothetical protein [Acidobacteriota bacterium]
MCALILAFIFLTPPAWFKTGEPPVALSHQISSKAALKIELPWSESLSANPGTDELERRTRELTGRSDLMVRGARQVRDDDGRLVAYEIDIE